MNEQPTFKVGDRVRFDFGTVPGTVIEAGAAPLVKFDDGEQRQCAWYALERIPQHAPEAWRLLFRAHRDGWGMYVDTSEKTRHGSVSRTRRYANTDCTLQVAVTTVKRPVR